MAAGDLLAGIAVAIWGFATFAYLAKMARRPAVVLQDLRVLPGRAGLAAMTMGGMAASGLIAAHSGFVASILLIGALIGHAALAIMLIRLLSSLPPEGSAVTPTLHLSFAGFILGAPAAIVLGWLGLATVLFWATIPVAAMIWALTARQAVRVLPPAPLRPMLAIHIAPAAVLCSVASLLGKPELAWAFAVMAGALAGFILVPLRWTVAAGPSPLWGAFTFPLAALATAYLLLDGASWPGLAVLLIALVVNPVILWSVLKRWPGGKLAALTNAAEA